MTRKKCPECNQRIGAGSSTCTNCGRELEKGVKPEPETSHNKKMKIPRGKRAVNLVFFILLLGIMLGIIVFQAWWKTKGSGIY